MPCLSFHRQVTDPNNMSGSMKDEEDGLENKYESLMLCPTISKTGSGPGLSMKKADKISHQEALAALSWQVDAGADEAIGEAPLDRFEATENTELAQPAESPREDSAFQKKTAPEATNTPAPQIDTDTVPAHSKTPAQASASVSDVDAAHAAAKAKTLEELKAVVSAFEGCNLKRTAMNTVFSDGNPKADLMFIGEAPGADEDRQGKPFVGASGQLLDRMMAALGMNRAQDYYISNIIPWRPPGNRKPTTVEVTICLPFILRHLELVKPKVIVLLGATAASALLDATVGITKIRGQWRELEVGGKPVPIMPIYHPAYLLRQPRVKRESWRDLQEIRSKLLSSA